MLMARACKAATVPWRVLPWFKQTKKQTGEKEDLAASGMDVRSV